MHHHTITMTTLKQLLIACFLLGPASVLPLFAQVTPAVIADEPLDNTPIDAAVWNGCTTPCAAWGSTDVRYPRNVLPSLPSASGNLAGWRGEKVHAQAVVWSGTPLSSLTFSVEPFVMDSKSIPSNAITAGFVRYVRTDEYAPGCGARPQSSQFDSSLVADRIDTTTRSLPLPAGQVRCLWLSCRIPAGAAPGLYKGAVKVMGDGKLIARLPLTIRVVNRLLPPPSQWKFHLDLWQNPFAVARLYQVPLWSEAHLEAMRPLMKILADAGQKVITASIMHHPWNAQTYDAFESMVTWSRKLDGSWQFDFSVFDRWVQFMMELGIDRQINCYSMVPWRASFLYFDCATNRMQEWKASPGEAAYDEVWGAMLSQFEAHLKSKGWLDKTAIAMDERPMEVMQKALRLIHRSAPHLKVSLAGNYHAPIENDLYDYCIAVEQQFPDSVLAARQAAGKVSTFYTCCAQLHPNTFTFSSPADAAWIGPYCASRGLDGYLRWSYNSWPKSPLVDSRFTAFPSGDTYIVYPGAGSSVRMEKMIEGIQTYEKIQILRQEKSPAQYKAVERELGKFDMKNFDEGTAASHVQAVEKLLNR